jgi:hypothetical protein
MSRESVQSYNGVNMAELLLTFGEAEIFSYPNSGPEEAQALFQRMTGSVISTAPAKISHVSGWVASTEELTSIEVRDAENKIRGITELFPAPDVAVTRQGLHLTSRRFTTAPECLETSCRAIFTFANGTRREIPLEALGDYPAREPNFAVGIDEIAGTDPAKLADQATQNRVHRLARQISRLYTLAAPLFVFTGILGTLFAAWRLRSNSTMVFLAGVGLAAFVHIVSRVALLSYLDVTTIRSLIHLYLAPSTPFVIIVAVLGNWLALQTLKTKPTTAA